MGWKIYILTFLCHNDFGYQYDWRNAWVICFSIFFFFLFVFVFLFFFFSFFSFSFSFLLFSINKKYQIIKVSVWFVIICVLLCIPIGSKSIQDIDMDKPETTKESVGFFLFFFFHFLLSFFFLILTPIK